MADISDLNLTSRLIHYRFRGFPLEIFVLTLIGTVLRLYRLGHESLWVGEIQVLQLVTERTLYDIVFIVPVNTLEPPLYYIITWGWIQAINLTSAVALRLPAAVFGIVSIPFFYEFARTTFHRRIAAVSTMLYVVHPFLIWHAQDAQLFSFLLLLTVLSFYLFVRMIKHQSRYELFGYTGTALLLAYTHVYGLFVIFAQIGFIVWRHITEKEEQVLPIKNYQRIFGLLGLLILPWIGFVVFQVVTATNLSSNIITWIQPPNFEWIHPFEWLTLLETFRVLSVGVTRQLLPYVRLADPPRILYLFVILSFILLFDDIRRNYREDISIDIEALVMVGQWVLVPVIVPFILSMMLQSIYRLEYIIVAAPAFILLVVRGAFRIRQSSIRYTILGVILIGLILPLPGFYALDQKEQWQETATYIEQNAGSKDIVIIVPGWTDRAFRTYFNDGSVEIKPMYSWQSVQAFRKTITNKEDIYLILSYATTKERQQTIQRITNATGSPPDTRRYLVKILIVVWNQ
ncbi:MAG: glycosyltransferase family 39 protein [Halobacteriaceae archaeon]